MIGTSISNKFADIAVAPSNPDFIYASYGTTLYVTTNGGVNWSVYSCPGRVTDICVSPSNPSKIWITTSDGLGRVHVSLNNGQNFANITGQLPAIAARSIVVDNTTDERLFVGMNIGVFTYSNAFPSWSTLTDNLPLVDINELDIQHNASLLRVATYGRGIWETSSIINTNCTTPSAINVIAVNSYSATLNWNIVSGAYDYTVEYKLSTDTTWLLASSSVGGNTYTITGLADTSIYDCRVQANCIVNSSSYIQSQFTTLSAPFCSVPSGLNVTAITSSSATILWDTVNYAQDYSVEYKLSIDTTWITAITSLSTTIYTLNGLSDTSIYDYRIQANCVSSVSAFAQSQFTTLAPVSLNNVKDVDIGIIVYPNPAREVIYIDFKQFVLNPKVTITNLIGEKMFESNNKIKPPHSIDINNWPKSIYFIKVLVDNEYSVIQKFIIE
jgi:hypothetical protein